MASSNGRITVQKSMETARSYIQSGDQPFIKDTTGDLLCEGGSTATAPTGIASRNKGATEQV